MAICVTARYTSSGVCNGGLTRIGKADRSFLICWSTLSHVAFHSKVLAPLSNLKNGFTFSASFGRNLDNASVVALPSSRSGSTCLGWLGICRGWPQSPLCDHKAEKRQLQKTHFSGLSLRSCFLTLARTASRSAGWRSAFWDLTTMLSMYTSMILPSRSWKILSSVAGRSPCIFEPE